MATDGKLPQEKISPAEIANAQPGLKNLLDEGGEPYGEPEMAWGDAIDDEDPCETGE
jgi:hypothetical protein